MHRPSAVLAAFGLAVAAGCGAGSSHQDSRLKGSITVYAAASLTGTFTDLAKSFEAKHPGSSVKLSLAGSSALATQIATAAAPADVFASASAKNMKQVTDAGAAKDPKDFARNVAEIAVRPGLTVSGLAGLTRLKVALCDPSVPCGALAVTVLANAHVKVKPVTEGLDVKSTLAYVTNGSADAAIVYVTDVLAAGTKVTGVEIPAAVNASTAYSIVPITRSRHAALARAFEDFVLSSAGQAVLTKAGFLKP